MPLTRVRKERETRLVSEYVHSKYKDAEAVRFRCPLGPIPEELTREVGYGKAIGLMRPFRPEVDALVVTKDEIVLIEGKIFKWMDGISKLPVYASLVPETPELKQFLGRRLKMVLVTPKDMPQIKSAAAALGVEVDIFRPQWVEDYLKELEMYWSPESTQARNARKKILEMLGYT